MLIDPDASAVGGNVTHFTSVDHSADPGFFLRFLDAVNTLPDAIAWKPIIFDGLRLQPGDQVLDLGCGAGADSWDLLARVGTAGRVTGIDISASLIQEAKRRALDRRLPVTFEVGDAQALRFSNATFDAVRTERLLMHVPNPEQALSEMTRVLRPGGRLAVHDFDWETQICDSPHKGTTRKIALSFCDTLKHGWIGRQLPRLFRNAGFAEVSTTFRVVTVPLTFLQLLLGGHVVSAVGNGSLTKEEADRWWTDLAEADQSGTFLYGFTAVIVAGTKS